MSYDPDEQFAEQLAVLEDRIASGGLHAAETQIDEDSAISARLHDALDCLQVLDRIWPRHTETAVPALPRKVGRFTLIRELGRGGFGIVHLAADAQLGRVVAVKLQRPEAVLSPDARRRFLKEAKAAAPLNHANLVTVFDSGEDGLWCWIASEVVRGPSLGAYLATLSPSPPSAHSPLRPSVPIEAACRLVAKLADGVAHAHLHSVLHRDIKPNNVLLQPDVPQPASLDDYTPKLTDFGLARLLEQEPGETRTGARLGTPAYMAPEQIEGRKAEIGEATDVYGLGVLLYELLAGHSPFAADTETEIIRRVLLEEPPPLRKARPDVSRDLEAVVLKALKKTPSRRYVSARALAEDLRRFQNHEPTTARPITQLQRAARQIRRHPAVCIAVAASAIALGFLFDSDKLPRIRQSLSGVRTVELPTQPIGARIVLVPLDEHSGEPLPQSMIRPAMRSPIVADCPYGDYLVIAVWDDRNFHEVYRHVPRPDEKIPEGWAHHRWKETENGRIALPRIRKPPAAVVENMALVDGMPSKNNPDAPAIAPFYLDRFEYTNGQHLRIQHDPTNDIRWQRPTYALKQNYNYALSIAEQEGKRLPSAAEFRAALRRCVTPAADGDLPGPVGTPADDLTDTMPTIVGLRTNVAEWTTSKVSKQSPSLSEAGNMLADRRLVLGDHGQVIQMANDHPIGAQALGWPDRERPFSRHLCVPGVGFRLARSASPQFVGPALTPND